LKSVPLGTLQARVFVVASLLAVPSRFADEQRTEFQERRELLWPQEQ